MNYNFKLRLQLSVNFTKNKHIAFFIFLSLSKNQIVYVLANKFKDIVNTLVALKLYLHT